MHTALLFVLAAILNPSAARTRDTLSLHGTHLFHAGDHPAWSAPNADESDWRPIRVPGSLQSQHIRTDRGLGWYRIHFTLPADFAPAHPAVFLGRIGNSDEAFLDGVPIGKEGRIGGKWVEASWGQRLYPVPPSLLRPSVDHLLAIRVLNTYTFGGIVEGPVAIGDYASLRVLEIDRERSRTTVEAVLLCVFAFLFIAALWGYAMGIRGPEILLFGITLLVFEAAYFLDSQLLYSTGWKTPAAQWAAFSL